jgi:ubiquinone/menaquinone biosynthesis C-methylase UbiE
MDESPDLGLYRRSNYKEVWTALSASEAAAKTHVGGSEDEGELTRSGIGTTNFLLENVGVDSSDVVLEIGCGIGRVGKQLASRCRKWIGCDVSARMLNLAADRLREFPNVELVETSGYDLKPITDVSVDLVYCTAVFMHLEQWDRYNYVEEAFRVLRAGGKLYVDNVDLCSEKGWEIFQRHRQFRPETRPAHITECSTPQELEEYLWRAGFEDIQTFEGNELVSVWGRRPKES